MEIAFINTPLGTAKIKGDENGVSEISVGYEEPITNEIPKNLRQAVNELDEYFYGTRNEFTFKLNLKGTEFQQRVWQEYFKFLTGKLHPI